MVGIRLLGSINVVTNEPVIGEYSGNMKVTLGDYARTDAQYTMNIPLSDVAARFALPLLQKNAMVMLKIQMLTGRQTT